MNRSYTQRYSCVQSILRGLSKSITNACYSVFLAAVFTLLLGFHIGHAQTINFTGDAEADFAGAGVSILDFNEIPDVGVPFQLGSVISGWDIKSVYFATDLNQLFIGIDYFGIAGDADGNGDPGSASPELESMGGQDTPDLGSSESIAVQIDIDQDDDFDLIAGVPARRQEIGCINFDLNDCFGLYNHLNDGSFSIAAQFGSLIDGTNTYFASPSMTAPDFEFTINWSIISEINSVDPDTCETFEFGVQLYSGSFIDAGIGEDFVPPPGFIPGTINTETVTLEVCADCEGILFGPNGPGECGCDVEEVDLNENGIIDCKEVVLDVILAGDGGGSVTSDVAGINCPGDCSEIYEEETEVMLTATPDAVSQFAGWTGDPDCEDGVVTLDEDTSCTATFDFLPLLLGTIFPAVSGNPNFMVADNATPNGPVAFIWGFKLGPSNVSIGCGSVELAITPFQMLGIVNAGANQIVNFVFFINNGTFANPAFTQAVDLDTCRVSDVIINIITNN